MTERIALFVTICNLGLVLINLILVGIGLKMLTEYWKDKKR